MRCWGELNSLRTPSVGKVSTYQQCVQFSGYVETKGSQATTSRKAGYTPVVCHRANRLQSVGETITIRSSSRDTLPSLLSSLKVTYSFLQEIKP